MIDKKLNDYLEQVTKNYFLVRSKVCNLGLLIKVYNDAYKAGQNSALNAKLINVIPTSDNLELLRELGKIQKENKRLKEVITANCYKLEETTAN